jgi:hypothetical protein
MTIFEYLSEPHPWIDLSNYTVTQVTLFLIGCLCWIAAYIDTVKSIIKRKNVDIPIAAVVLNFGWEIAACIFFVPDMGKLIVLAYWAWMVLDIYIYSSLFKYGFKQMEMSFFRKRLPFFLLLGLVISFFSQLFFMWQYELPLAPLTGYIINIIMSLSFLYLIFVKTVSYHSKITAWAKFLGTGIISIMFFTKYPDNNFLIVLYLAVAFFDIYYIYLVGKKNEGKIEAMSV